MAASVIDITNTGFIAGRVGIVEFAAASTPEVSLFDTGEISGSTAIEFAHAGNTLTLGSGYDIIGTVNGGTAGTLDLGGSGSASFDLSSVGASQQYQDSQP